MHIHKNCFNFGGAIITFAGVFAFLVGKSAERGSSLVILDDITWSDNVSKAITLCYLSAFLSLAPHDEDRVVLFNHLSHRGVASNRQQRDWNRGLQ
jgi:hypothetical protein